MMPEISLNILDVAQNSVTAGAKLTAISITADSAADLLTVSISDDGCGMTPEQVARVADPFFTTRKTRDIGLGVPFLKMSAEITGGTFNIESRQGEGTTVTVVFCLGNIDRMPMGDIGGTMTALIAANPDIDFVLEYAVDGAGFSADTRQFREVLGGDISLGEPAVIEYITGYINENIAECGRL